jgi:hypothetical protein
MLGDPFSGQEAPEIWVAIQLLLRESEPESLHPKSVMLLFCLYRDDLVDLWIKADGKPFFRDRQFDR